MHLKSLYLRNFRNYAEAQFSFADKLNIVYGDNAQGKTSLLEAIYLIATGRSFRTDTLSDLIRSGESFFFLEAHILRDAILQRVQVSFDGQTRKVQLDATTYATFHPLLGILPTVLYTPYDLELISGSPMERRRFLNLHLAQSDPIYVHHLTRFWRAMKQRNCLLRSKTLDGIECWEAEMVSSAEYIGKARAEMIQELDLPKLVAERQELQLQLSANPKTYLQTLHKNRGKEMELGLTLVGPHRDDLTILIDGKPARMFASEGQKKTTIAALKFAEWDRLSRRVGAPALICFDDLSGALDDARQALIQERLSTLGQVFITTPQTPRGEGYHILVKNPK
ncbi:MAG: DNA replication and repair protein RecF [Verrucomicrobia bacterium]|nr:DNA replication and repair protein RecF [Verrucomicrobiota bacterium]MDE3047697.1 DNA replication and repair protein RecF [Verrucomicrobiota bacterium]